MSKNFAGGLSHQHVAAAGHHAASADAEPTTRWLDRYHSGESLRSIRLRSKALISLRILDPRMDRSYEYTVLLFGSETWVRG